MKKSDIKLISTDEHFYLGIPIDAIWFNYFASVHMRDEGKCDEIFIKKAIDITEIEYLLEAINRRINI